jgi:carbonic anhydrase/acetyltransferase-like protein (isoleucine patch superfamily)
MHHADYKLVQPDIAPDVFIAAGARVLGDVVLASEASVWFNAVIRGDTEKIRVGRQTNLQDLALLHADPGFPCELGERVTVGHGAIVHGAVIEDEVMIGMGAIVMNGARIGRGSLIAAGALVLEGMLVPPQSVVMGSPARVRRVCDDRDVARIRAAAEHYVQQSRRFLSR